MKAEDDGRTCSTVSDVHKSTNDTEAFLNMYLKSVVWSLLLPINLSCYKQLDNSYCNYICIYDFLVCNQTTSPTTKRSLPLNTLHLI